VIEEKNIFKQLLGMGARPYFANAFPQRFFDYVNRHRTRMTVTTLSCIMSGVPLLKAQDLRMGNGISADITSEGWKELGYPDIPVIETAEAGRRLVELASKYDFVLFEYWKTDHAGHSANFAEAIEVLERFDGMLAGIIETLDTRSTLLLITSDHGNVEDMSVKTHTRNPVPAILFGRGHDTLAERLHPTPSNGADLTRVKPLLMEYITERN
jgi:predicted AlkP superfamily pyrophosphatase or phosphodiesterase